MWTPYQHLDTDLAGLVEAVAAVLSLLTVDVHDERVREVPNARVLRYYQSTGLLDRPVRYDGRRAMYGFRHLVQAVSVKVLQSEGMSLAQIQGALSGRSTDELARLIAQAAQQAGAVEPSPSRQAGEPAPVLPPSLSPALQPVLQAELAPGVTLLLDPSQVADPQAIVAALVAALPPRGV
jgi:DNA-binding transcriptional MerR regulator